MDPPLFVLCYEGRRCEAVCPYETRLYKDYPLTILAWAAASRATGTRKGEQLT